MHMIEFLNRDRNTGVAKIFIDRDQVPTAVGAGLLADSSIIFVGDHSFEVTGARSSMSPWCSRAAVANRGS